MLQLASLKVLAGSKGASLFGSDLWPRPRIILGIVLLTAVWGLAIVFASTADGTLHLPGGGRGLLDHYGFQASFAAAPLVLVTVYFAVSYFLQCLRDMHDILDPSAERSEVLKIIHPHVQSLCLRTAWRNVLWLFMFIGTAVSIVIFRNLQSPVAFWGNDVFNATSYRYGFASGNLFLLVLWGLIYPVGFFYAVHLTLSAELIVARLKKRRYLKLNFLHPDKCGGMARFGTLNFLVMLIYLWPFCAVYALHVTHRYTYSSLVIGAIAITAAFVLQSIYGIYWISRSIRAERETAIVSLNERISKAMESSRKNFSAATAILQYRDKVLGIASYPYSSKVSVAVNLLRTAPAILTVANFVIAYLRAAPH